MDETSERQWLLRLSVNEWLTSATNELGHCKDALERRSYRTGVTHARRGTGMALNALLRLRYRAEWGRSYMDHIVALALDTQEPQNIRLAAQTLVDTKPQAPELVTLGKPDMQVLEAAKLITNWVKARVQTLTAAQATN